jgi:hypothetical protein
MSNWLTGSIDEGTVADVPRKRATQSATFGMVFRGACQYSSRKSAGYRVHNEKGLIATRTLEGLLFDLDMICNDNGQTALLLQSPHLV